MVLHVEPDLWGFLQVQAKGDKASSVPAMVASSGMPELAGLPDDASGVAQAFVRLRDQYASNVSLGYHLSVFGTGEDPLFSNPSSAHIDALARRSADFYNSLGANFDVVFTDASDRDAGFKQYEYKDGGASWWDEGDYSRNIRYLSDVVDLTQKRVVIWQIPLGNTRMRAENNTRNHYQDNHVEWFLEDQEHINLARYAQAGVIALLFGRGADGATCACDSNKDGITNPDPIGDNTGESISADDDGGYFRYLAAAYYQGGRLLVGQQSEPVAVAKPVPLPTATPIPASACNQSATSPQAAAYTYQQQANLMQPLPYGFAPGSYGYPNTGYGYPPGVMPVPAGSTNSGVCTATGAAQGQTAVACAPGVSVRSVVEIDPYGRLTLRREPC